MSSQLEMLVTQKELLVARASLQRLQAAHEVEAISESLRWPRPLASVATSSRPSPWRHALLSSSLRAVASPARRVGGHRGHGAGDRAGVLEGTLMTAPSPLQKLKEEREAMSRELNNPTPEQKAEEDRYWAENPDLFGPRKDDAPR